eukprot:CAMPEP_0118661964 /NCGR_PEP_ID=MMETSP0785-20121206/16568_1 /TAXON_ID=91992 /ORGANISM="Bolidomonas pacifica, Strain CCMP 1866" /LENGTH=115 /DNA_ID=CAMNT_0006555455 /DNA_START=231 /DNA_END=578 /DNA_ORIENTATION=-
MSTSITIDVVLLLILIILTCLLCKLLRKIRAINARSTEGQYKPLSRQDFNDMVDGVFDDDDDDDDDDGINDGWDGDMEMGTWNNNNRDNNGVKVKLDFTNDQLSDDGDDDNGRGR